MTELADWLTGPDGAAAIAAAQALPDSLAGVSTLRANRPGLTAEQASAAMTQAALRRHAAERYGLTMPLLLSRDGLEQATRPDVAAERARLISAGAPARIIDATAGLGFDTAALVATGAPVIAIERDPQIATYLRANVPGAQVHVGDAVDLLDTLSPGPDDIVFIDPARRDHRRSADGARAHPERDPERWSPPWSFVTSLSARTRVCAKVAPGISHSLIPHDWCAQWTSVRRTPVEACLFSWHALPEPRRALLVGEQTLHLDGVGLEPGPIGPIGRWLHEPDPAIIAAGLVDDLINAFPAFRRIDSQPQWLSSDEAVDVAFCRSYRVIEALPTATKELRRALRNRGLGSLTIKTRGARVDADHMRRRLQLGAGGREGILVLTDVAGRPAAYLVDSA